MKLWKSEPLFYSFMGGVKKGRERKDENMGSPQGCGRGKEDPEKVVGG